uniref:Aspartyl/glutamyl-tRNA(Asn/Gln) amidotransferase subunit C n=1 Tax=Candidatus Kentrum sp. TC TaxID=2126339 RepID=A0A450Z0K9_9GAMM|nr:MAG: aspartyl-tRNA(Asn)/glutamyl-tRNA(Gln) amidotransferase subunit C [Candidatus Kentron sp. TC]VFK47278.1 MAG: aspartyl/glutamyl-tRNA(Asn/Gln) amidotransferase subunit C [Candidatus Kentron sp. TC]VFK57537.1 MAG: aspartyl-tRNA(Asn)/glutamyl-tRNA(Gln) amidotransferase subunit C [Candidatus Kentron sp. TC]
MDKADVEQIASLARLTIEPENVAHYAHDLSNILKLVKQMEKLDTTEVTPMAHPMDTTQRLRSDTITEGNQRMHFQENAPLSDIGLYLVPKVIE